MDWARIDCDRFWGAVLPRSHDEDSKRRAVTEMARVRTVVDSHKELLYAVFSYYSVTNGQRGERIAIWTMPKFLRFCDEVGVVDPTSEGSRKEDLENLFIAAVQTLKAQNASQKGRRSSIVKVDADVADDRAVLLRHGFIGSIIRLAAAKFTDLAESSLAWAVQRLVCDLVLREAPELAQVDRDVFRSVKLYAPEVEDVYKKYMSSLEQIFEFYAGSEDETSQRKELMTLDEWHRLVSDAELTDAIFTRRESAFCFLFSQMFVADEVKRCVEHEVEVAG